MSDTISTLAQKLRPHWLRDLGASVTATSGGGSGMIAHTLSGGYHTGELDPSQAPWALTATRNLIAGAGLTGGGDLTADRTFTVGAGYGITVNADDVALASSAAGNGLTYTNGVLAVGVSGLGLGVGADAVTLTSSSDVGTSPAAAILASNAQGGLTLNNGFFTQGAASQATFASGFAGSGWRVDYGVTTASRASAEVDDLTVRGRMRVYELLIQQIRATNGSVFVSSASKVVGVTTSTNPLWTVNGVQLTFNGDNATLSTTIYTITTAAGTDTDGGSNDRRLYHGFLYGDLIRAQQVRWDGAAFAGIIQSNLEVTTVTNLYTYGAALVSGDAAEVGYDYVRLGNSRDTSRQGSIYLTSDDSAAPFIDIVDGVSLHLLWNSPNVARVRVGKLSGISDSAFGGALSGYGLYGNNVYLKGQMVITGGDLGGLAAADVNANTTTIDGGHITANSVTASQLSVTTLSAITADMGSLTAGNIVIGTTNKIWLNEAADGALNIGGSTKASAPFQVTAAGALTATNATITGAVTATSGSFTGAVTSTSGTIGGWTLGATSLTAGSGANTVSMDSGGTNPAFYAGSATPASAPFRVSKTGVFYTGTGGTGAGDKYISFDGADVAIKGTVEITGNSTISGILNTTGSIYAGGANVRLSTDGIRLVHPDLPAPDVKAIIPTNSSAMRWLASITDAWTNAQRYAGVIAYKDTTGHYVDLVAMSYVGSTDYGTYYARSMLYANRFNGSTDKECRVEAAVDPGSGGAYVTAACDTFYTSADAYIGDDIYIVDNCSALTFTDRTPFYDGDALTELRLMKGTTRSTSEGPILEIDHATLPAFARKRVIDTKTREEHDERDLGAMISMLTTAVRQLDTRLGALEGNDGRQ